MSTANDDVTDVEFTEVPNGKQSAVSRNKFLDNKLNRLLVALFVTICIMIIFASISLWAIMKITDHQTSPEKLKAMREMAEIQEKMGRVTEAKSGDAVKNTDYVQPSQQKHSGRNNDCINRPKVGWDYFYRNNHVFNDDEGSRCMELSTPPGKRWIPVLFNRRIESLRGKFLVYDTPETFCDSEKSADGCLSFVRNQVGKEVAFSGDVFIQPAPF